MFKFFLVKYNTVKSRFYVKSRVHVEKSDDDQFTIYYIACLDFTLNLDLMLHVVLTENNVKSRLDCILNLLNVR